MDISKETRLITGQLKKHDREINQLKKVNSFLSCSSILFNWVLILISIYGILFLEGPLTLLFFLILGSRMRALMNLIHDGSHNNLFSNSKVNDFVVNIFCAYFMFESIEKYRKSHLLHHKFLGTILDPDVKEHKKQGFDDLTGDILTIKKLFLISINRNSISYSLFNNFLKNNQKINIFTFWLILVITIGFSPLIMIKVIGILLIAKLFFYHPIRVIAEFLDHAGLKTEGLLSYTRTLPIRNFLSIVLRPHNDHFHLLHHLNPSIPHYSLEKAHKIYLRSKLYGKGNFYNSYLFGKNTIFKWEWS